VPFKGFKSNWRFIPAENISLKHIGRHAGRDEIEKEIGYCHHLEPVETLT
jgi:hypothetical protein